MFAERAGDLREASEARCVVQTSRPKFIWKVMYERLKIPATLAIGLSRDSPLARCLVSPSPAWPPPHRVGGCTQKRYDQENVSSYCCSSWRSASLDTPETVPVNSPVLAKKTGLFNASAKTGTFVSVKVRVPDASLKRPVPLVI
jgi:hypothetical protein